MRRRSSGAVIAALVAAVAVPVVVAAPAQATAYRYWSYWHDTGSGWQFSRVGATGAHPADGTVEGWRFAVSPGTASAPAPRYDASTAFTKICGATDSASGKKRVALVVDFGVRGDAATGDEPPSAPLRGTCVVIRAAANGWDVLVAGKYPIRSDDGLVCGLSGYPSHGCGDVVADPRPRPTSTPTPKPAPADAPAAGSHPAHTSASANGARGHDNDGTTAATSNPTSSDAARSTATASSSNDPRAADVAARTSATAIPSADALDSSSALPSLVEGAPAADSSGSSSSPLFAVLGLLLVAAIGAGAFVRNRRAR